MQTQYLVVHQVHDLFNFVNRIERHVMDASESDELCMSCQWIGIADFLGCNLELHMIAFYNKVIIREVPCYDANIKIQQIRWNLKLHIECKRSPPSYVGASFLKRRTDRRYFKCNISRHALCMAPAVVARFWYSSNIYRLRPSHI